MFLLRSIVTRGRRPTFDDSIAIAVMFSVKNENFIINPLTPTVAIWVQL